MNPARLESNGCKSSMRCLSPTMLSAALVALLLALATPPAAAIPGPSDDSSIAAPDPAELRWLDADPRILDADGIRRRVSEGQRWIRIVVNLVPTPTIEGFGDWQDRDRAEIVRSEISLLQADLLSSPAGNEFRLRHMYENLASVSGEVTLEGIARLLEDPNVDSVETVIPVKTHDAQGIPLMNPGTVRDSFDGSGISVAVVDSGIDYSHEYLGYGGFPNGKVLGGYDFYNNDGNPLDDNGHGTSCASIIAGKPVTNGDYIGGVAPGAKLYALKTTDAAGNGSSDDITAAWDWCVTHQYDDPQNPILLINNSLGGGEYAAGCDGSLPSLSTAAANCVAAGMTVFASSGNDAFCDAMGFPACLNDVVSVGAVYDDNIAGLGFCVSGNSCVAVNEAQCDGFACWDLAPIKDNVCCFSNSAVLLELLAPSYNATTAALGGGLGSSFGGTSAACPYAVGAAACLQEAARPVLDGYMNSQDLRTTLRTTGQPIVDLKNGRITNRVDLQAAFDTLPSPIDACQGIDNEITLRVNGNPSPVIGLSRFVPQTWTMLLPSGGGNGKFFVHVNNGSPTHTTLYPLPANLGKLCFPLLPQSSPIGIFNNLGKPNVLGTSEWGGNAIPDPPRAPNNFFFLPALYLPVGAVITLQGAILNPNASGDKPASVTNSVTVITLP